MTVTIPQGKKCAAFDCNKAARPNGWFCSDACRSKTWRKNHPEYQPPPGQSSRQNAAERLSRVSMGGAQVSYQRTWVRVARGLRYELNVPSEEAVRLAKSWVRDVVPERQRARAS